MNAQGAEMLRLARTPKWIGLGLVAIAIVIACIVLGRWQYSQTFNIIAAERVSQSAPVDVEQAMTVEALPDAAIGRPVTASGRYLADGQVAILQRSLDGRPGVWILTPLQLPSGSVIGVLRGWLPSAGAPGAEPPGDEVRIQGRLHPEEPFYADAVTEPGTALAIGPRLREAWGAQALPAFVMLTDEQPVVSPAPLPVPATVQTADVAFPLRNFVYAFQWWVFAAFALIVYARWLWLDARRESQDTVVAP